MGEQTKNMLIGLFVIVACVTIVWLIMFLKPTVGDGKQTLYVRFANINQINVGTRVLFGGKPVGEVAVIQEINDARKKPLSDVLGVGTEPIYAQSVDPIEMAFTELSSVSKEMKKTFQLASSWIQKNGDDVAGAIHSFGNAMAEVQTAVAKINTQEIMDDIQAGARQFTITLKDIQDSIQELKAGDVFVNAGHVMDNMKAASADIKNITKDIADGKGTLGQLIVKDDFYLDLSAVLSKANTMMNDINHYGILFHLNKSWQRQRAQQMSMVNSLDSPKNFKNYFQSEVSEINTAMTRLSLVIDKAEKGPKSEEILNDDQFRKDFRELLRQAEALSNNLKLYNEQLSGAAN